MSIEINLLRYKLKFVLNKENSIFITFYFHFTSSNIKISLDLSNLYHQYNVTCLYTCNIQHFLIRN